MTAVTPMLLGIAGEKESGKNTAASILEELCGDRYRYSSRGLADVLKISAARSLGFKEETEQECIELMDSLKVCGSVTTRIEYGKYDEQEMVISGREFLQNYGTEGHREVFGDNFWIDYLIPRDTARFYRRWSLDHILTQMMMVTDCRFDNEAERVKSLGGFVLEIKKPGSQKSDKHKSEAGLSPHLVDEIIHNDAGIKELGEKIADFFDRRVQMGLASGSGSWA